MKTIKELEDILFDEWHSECRSNLSEIENNNNKIYIENKEFIEDGLVNEDGWNEAPIKVIFILKEINNSKKDIYKNHRWNLRQYLLNGELAPKDKTYRNVSRWAYGILNNVSKWDNNVEKIGNDINKRKENLRKIGVINVSKQPGVERTKFKDLECKFSEYNKLFLEKQLALYTDAKLIICCGSGVCDLFKQSITDMNFGNYKAGKGITDDETGIWYTQLERGQILISYKHPSIIAGNEKLFNNLMKLTNKLLKEID